MKGPLFTRVSGYLLLYILIALAVITAILLDRYLGLLCVLLFLIIIVSQKRRGVGSSTSKDASLELLMTQVPAVIWSTNRDLVFTGSIGSGLNNLGLKVNEVVGLSLYDYFQTDDPDFVAIKAQKEALRGESRTYEMEWAGRTFRSHVEPLRNNKGIIIGSVGIALDVTERIKTEHELRQRLRQQAAVTSLGQQALAGSDLSSLMDKAVALIPENLGIECAMVLEWEPEEESLKIRSRFGCAELENANKRVRCDTGSRLRLGLESCDRFFSVTGEEVNGWLDTETGLSCGVLIGIEEQNKRFGFLGAFSRTPGKFSKDDMNFMISISNVLSTALARKHVLEEQRVRAEAEAANRAKDEFISILSHELRTPLTVIMGWTEILSSWHDTEDSETVNLALETIRRAVKTQLSLVDDLLDVSSIVSGRVRLERAPINLVSIIKRAVDDITPTAVENGLTLEAFYDQPVICIDGDPLRIQQIVWNLISNAIKFTDAGGAVKVEVGVESENVTIRIVDNGRGIPADFLPNVFDRFSQVKSGDKKLGGIGLGLAIVKHLVELHSGTIKVDSKGVGQGATFTVTLPLLLKQSQPVCHPTEIEA
jgi:PAS domain S-box-containing protein